MNLKYKLIAGYFSIGILFAIYSWMYGDTAHKSFAYNFGVGLFWITHLPVVGKIINEILSYVIGFIMLVVFFIFVLRK